MTRPLLHHTVERGWLNDPHALVHHEGRYHLLFQYVPDLTEWDVGCRWGHAVSTDLLTWEAAPVALAPDAEDDGCWSGNLVLAPEPVAFYTAVNAPDVGLGRVRRAVPTDPAWTGWAKQGAVVEVPPGAGAAHFRDPFVHRHGDGWRMLVGGGTSAGVATVWAFTSPDLETWTSAGVAASRPSTAGGSDGEEWTGTVWECPVLVEVGGRQVLVVSVWDAEVLHHLAYAVCDPTDDELRPGTWHRLSYGPSHYAASVFEDAEGRTCLLTWLREVSDTDAGWAGAHSLPMRVTTDGDRLVAAPHPVLLARRRSAARGALPAAADVEWAPGVGSSVRSDGFVVAAGAGAVTISAGEHEVVVPWDGGPLRLVVDGPVLEVFGGLGVAAVPVTRALEGPLEWRGAEPVVHALATA